MLSRREILRELVDGVPPGFTVSVRADWIKELVADLPEPEPGVEIDLTAEEVGRLLGRDPKTIASWCRMGTLEGAYRLNDREWRIPRPALTAYQRKQA